MDTVEPGRLLQMHLVKLGANKGVWDPGTCVGPYIDGR